MFNIMQEGTSRLGYPLRLPLDVALVFTANPERLYRARQDCYTAQRPHRLGESARTIPARWKKAISITQQESMAAA